jgi:hypothetical protein
MLDICSLRSIRSYHTHNSITHSLVNQPLCSGVGLIVMDGCYIAGLRLGLNGRRSPFGFYEDELSHSFRASFQELYMSNSVR